MGIKILQTNLGRARVPHDLAYATAIKKNVDILVVGEPNKRIVQANQWIKDKTEVVAVMFTNKNIQVSDIQTEDGYISVKLRKGYIYCCYFSPNISFEDFGKRVDRLMEDVGTKRGEKIIMGDINAKSPAWGSPIEDRRGEYWNEWMAALDLAVLNDGRKPTFIRGNTKSYIDVTCSTKQLQNEISNWEVLDEETATEHQYISFEIETRTKKAAKIRNKYVCDWEVFKELSSWKIEKQSKRENDIETIIKDAYKTSLIKTENSRVPFWWNSEIRDKRSECLGLRREATRLAKHTTRESNHKLELYKKSKKELKALINKSKNEHWQNLCNELENDVWGMAYKIATKKLTTYAPCSLAIEEQLKAAEGLFPRQMKTWQMPTDIVDIEPFTINEYLAALHKLKVGKAPGIDGIPIEALKKIEEIKPAAMLDIFNGHLKQQIFPKKWKRAKLVLVPKGKIEDKTFRPICLLDSYGKLYEGLLKGRLEKEIEMLGGLSDRQFGFRKGRSTIQAVESVIKLVEERAKDKWVALITLDVKNAFNTAAWDIILTTLRQKGVSQYLINTINSYLDERSVQLDKKTQLEVFSGVPQGSILGPTLWNVLYDGVLETVLPGGAYTVAYADDLALVVADREAQGLVWKGNEAIEQIERWMTRNKLELAPQKTECVLLRGGKKREEVGFLCRGVEIKPKKSVVYLGITMGQGGSFDEHFKNSVIKAEEKAAQLMRVTANVRGPSFKKKKMLYSVIQSVLLYGAPIWCKSLKKKNVRKLTRTQRTFMIRVASAYRTVSAEALQVITGIPPIELLAEERRILYCSPPGSIKPARDKAREQTIQNWQERWTNNTRNAQWTKTVITDLDGWIKCRHRGLSYYLTQALTGHGCFKTYTKRIGKTDDDICMYCSEVDTADHTLFGCGKWENEREQTSRQLGQPLSRENMAGLMVKDRESWNLIEEYVKKVMQEKEKDERSAKITATQ